MNIVETRVLNNLLQDGNVPFDFFSGGIFDMDESYRVERQNYNKYLLVYTTEGEGRLFYKEKEYSLFPGMAFLIDCQHFHVYRTAKKRWKFYWVHFTTESLREYVDTLYEKYGAVFHISEGALMQEMIRSVIFLFQGYNPTAPYQAFGQIASLLGMLYSSVCKERVSINISEDTKRTLRLIEERYNEKLTLEYISREIGCSKYYLSRQFKADTGMAIHGYLILFRISKARVLLQNTNLTVENIAEEIGFSCVSNFIRTFAEYENVTPYQYRRQWSFK